ncbi:MAG: flagellar hook-basal body complex protein FliE [Clostridia bacterium]|nr:flagellar hook-basal body complex protein FliE [Clostridia bacterium]
MAINGLNALSNISSPSLFESKTIQNNENKVENFGEYLKSALDKVNDLQMESEALKNDFAAGKTDNIHQVMIAGEKADLALQFTMQIRNKILDAYNEIMRMQI